MTKRVINACRPFLRRAAAELLGLACWAFASGWLYLDVRPDGQVTITTACGVLVLAALGGWLIDKNKTRDALGFLKEQGQGFVDMLRNGGAK